MIVGVLGVTAGITLNHAAAFAALLASIATAAFMGLSAWEKFRAIRAAGREKKD